jgi:preprotein translocase subunit SecF
MSAPERPAPRFQPLRWTWYACVVSLLVLAAGLAAAWQRGVPVGIDFSGGTVLVVEFDRAGVGEADVRRALASLAGAPVVQRYGPVEQRRMLIRVAPDSRQTVSLEADVRRVGEALRGAALPPFEIVERELVTAAVGRDLQRRAAWATTISVLAVVAFIAVRFRPSFALGAGVAVIHDLLVTLACVTLAGYELSLSVVAALLVTIGYSVNDTIVVFDRVRENLAGRRGVPLGPVVERSVGQTLRRTVITSGTTGLAVLALYLLGGEVLRGFAFTMLAGVMTGTYSSIFIAPAVAVAADRRGGRGRRGPGIEPPHGVRGADTTNARDDNVPARR